MLSPGRILLFTIDSQLAFHLQLRLQSKGYQATHIPNLVGVPGACYSDPPDLLLFDLSNDPDAVCNTVNILRSDSFFSAIPIIGLFPAVDENFDWQLCPMDDFIQLPLNFSEFFSRVSLSLSRLKRIFDNNPLSRLPGNTSIQRAIEDAIGKPLAVCYVDINHFKPYNDMYGFSHGDEVIRMLARIIFNAVRDSGGGFCGHIGGDDFVYILPIERAEPVCQTVIAHFEQIILDMFEEVPRKQGFYYGINRKGEAEPIPLPSISIAVVPTGTGHIMHFAKVAEVAAELKSLAKESPGSRYVIDQRRS